MFDNIKEWQRAGIKISKIKLIEYQNIKTQRREQVYIMQFHKIYSFLVFFKSVNTGNPAEEVGL